jgi:large subunit ribosomal protein L5
MQGNSGLDAGQAPEERQPEGGVPPAGGARDGQEAAGREAPAKPAGGRAPRQPRQPRGGEASAGAGEQPQRGGRGGEPRDGADAPKGGAAARAGDGQAKPAQQRPGGRQQAPQAGGQQRGGQPRDGQRRGPAGKPAAPSAPARPMVKPRLLARYQAEVIDVLKREFGYSNSMQVPRLRKIVLNIGLGEALKNAAAVEAATRDMTAIAGQKPVVTKSRLSIANFGLREGQVVGVMVTLRDARMWHFFDRLVSFALPRVRDFRGVARNSFDGRGSYTLGLSDQIVFPEIDYNKIDRLRGLQITIVTSARTDEEARRLLELLGMPFARVAERVARPA